MNSTDLDHAARAGTKRVVFDLLRATRGDDGIMHRPISPEHTVTHAVPADYSDGIIAARRVAAHANRLVNEYARAARGEGRTWHELAGPLGIDATDEEIDPAIAAFERVAGPTPARHDSPWTSWRCGSCNKVITDRGPYNGHPVDCETGHAETCQRHQDAIHTFDMAYEHRFDGLEGEDLG